MESLPPSWLPWTPDQPTADTVPKHQNIDDLRDPGISDAAACHEKIDTQGVDNIAATLLAWAAAFDLASGAVEVTLSTGEILRGKLADDWTAEQLQMWAALLDLVG